MTVLVIAAYATAPYPLSGKIAEEVLELETGEAVYRNHGLTDEVYPDLEEALAQCAGEPTADPGLLSAWAQGYDIQQYAVYKQL